MRNMIPAVLVILEFLSAWPSRNRLTFSNLNSKGIISSPTIASLCARADAIDTGR